MTFKNQFVGLSVKQILINELGFSKRALTSLKARRDGILINGSHATVRAIVRENDVLEINIDDESTSEEKLVPSNTIPDVIYEDDDVVAVNKPPLMPTHQSQGHFYDTLANSLAYYYSVKERPFVFRSVNRLDKNTSGIVLVAKNRLASAKLSSQMKEGNIHKTYLAILQGALPEREGVIETHIRRVEKSIILREVCKQCEDSKIAVTKYRVIAMSNGLSLVEAMPITGRTHQLRVHFAHLNAQILGDTLYGERSPLVERHALHAYKLCFCHPNDNRKMEIIAPLPIDMKLIIEEYFGKEYTDYGK